MELELFTILCEFKGGTYISQLEAADAPRAVTAWANRLRQEKPIEGASDRIAQAAAEAPGKLFPLSGLAGVWCWTATIDDDLVIANIVRSAGHSPSSNSAARTRRAAGRLRADRPQAKKPNARAGL